MKTLKAPDVAEMWTDRQTGWDYSSDGIGAVLTVSARTVSSYKADVVGGNMTCLCVNVSEKTVETVAERFLSLEGLDWSEWISSCNRGHKSTHKSGLWERRGRKKEGRKKERGIMNFCECVWEGEQREREILTAVVVQLVIVYLSYLRLHDDIINQVLLAKLYHEC